MSASYWRALSRRKLVEPNKVEISKLDRVLGTFDLTALGVGSTLGVGVYVLAGHVAKDFAGPSVVLSFLIAAIASLFAGLCYAEFGARVPRAGSAYIYSYVCIGEFIAFIIGWNLVLEYVIGSASVSRGLSLYLDTLINDTLKHAFKEVTPIGLTFMSPYFDFFAFAAAVLLSVALSFGLKKSSIVNNVFTLINVGVVLFVIIAGAFKADPANWNIDKGNLTEAANAGEGGFFPFGISGTIKGAATCFYGFVGFDCIATTGEEVKNPQRAIPMAILISLAIIFLSYFGVSTIVTLMLPYYLQDPNAPIPHVFEVIGWPAAKWVVAIGGIFGLCASLFGAMFPLPRIIYAMATDGLVFRFLGKIHKNFKTPVVGTLLAGLLTGSMAALFDLQQLVSMMSIGTLLAYTIVAACVLLLRYEDDLEDMKHEQQEDGAPLLSSISFSDSDEEEEVFVHSNLYEPSEEDENPTSKVKEIEESSNLVTLDKRISATDVIVQIFNVKCLKSPSKLSARLVTIEISIYCILSLVMGLCLMYGKDDLALGSAWILALTGTLGGLLILILFSISLQPTSSKVLSFKVPLVPLVPGLSIFVNIYLMLMLDSNTWIRFAVWMAVGLPIYFTCLSIYDRGIRNPDPNISPKSTVNGGPVKANGHLAENIQYAYENKVDLESVKEFRIDNINRFPSSSECDSIEEDKSDEILRTIQNYQNEIKQEKTQVQELIDKLEAPSSDAHVQESEKVLALLDEVLNQEELTNISKSPSLTSLNASSGDLFERPRKLSEQSVLSNNESPKKNVVAMIHQEDQISLHQENMQTKSADDIEENNLLPPAVLLSDDTKDKEDITKAVEGVEISETADPILKSNNTDTQSMSSNESAHVITNLGNIRQSIFGNKLDEILKGHLHDTPTQPRPKTLVVPSYEHLQDVPEQAKNTQNFAPPIPPPMQKSASESNLMSLAREENEEDVEHFKRSNLMKSLHAEIRSRAKPVSNDDKKEEEAAEATNDENSDDISKDIDHFKRNNLMKSLHAEIRSRAAPLSNEDNKEEEEATEVTNDEKIDVISDKTVPEDTNDVILIPHEVPIPPPLPPMIPIPPIPPPIPTTPPTQRGSHKSVTPPMGSGKRLKQTIPPENERTESKDDDAKSEENEAEPRDIRKKLELLFANGGLRPKTYPRPIKRDESFAEKPEESSNNETPKQIPNSRPKTVNLHNKPFAEVLKAIAKNEDNGPTKFNLRRVTSPPRGKE